MTKGATRGAQRVEFEGSQGNRLAARLDLPESEPAAFALFAHCFTCSKDSLAAARICAGLAATGIAVLRFDFTGLGSSEGDFANTNFSSNVDDLLAAADFLRTAYSPPALLVGHSFGGAAVLAAAARVPEAKAVATIAAPADPAHVAHLFAAGRPEIDARGEAEVVLGGRPFNIRKQFLDDIEGRNLAASIGGMRKALLLFHAPLDTVVDVENAAQIFLAAKHPKSFVSLDGADHLLTNSADADYVANVLAAWASRYIGAAEPADTNAEQARDDSKPRAVRVRETGDGAFRQAIAVGPHRLYADEPAAVGGTDTGLTPYELVLAGLGACTSMTLRMYAQRKQWPLEGISVELSHSKIHAADCAECETREGKIDRIERAIEIEGPLDAEQRERLVQIADRCPVHRTLHSEIQISTRLKA